jgi:hypothetical protein
MTRERLQSAGEICHGPRAWEMFCKGWLDPCWILVDMAVTWCRVHNVEPLSAWVESPHRPLPAPSESGAQFPDPAPAAELSGKKGRRPEVAAKVRGEMLADIRVGKADELRRLSHKEMARRYSGSSNTCTKVRSEVLAEAGVPPDQE